MIISLNEVQMELVSVSGTTDSLLRCRVNDTFNSPSPPPFTPTLLIIFLESGQMERRNHSLTRKESILKWIDWLRSNP